ncbi:MAG: hypothetical protein O7G87_10910 [bacterium]|nr:hypothetical protein [bacterium]
MRRLGWLFSGLAVLMLFSMMGLGCGGGDGGGDNNLPTRRAKMRDIKLSTDRIMAALKLQSLEGVKDDAARIQTSLNAVVDLYPTEHKQKYVQYNKEAQQVALVISSSAGQNDKKTANKKFRELVPYCGKCHEDCAYMLAPAFPEYEN